MVAQMYIYNCLGGNILVKLPINWLKVIMLNLDKLNVSFFLFF